VIKWNREKWVGYVARMWERRGVCRILVGIPERERDHLGYPGVNGKIMLRWVFRKWDVKAWTGLIWLRIETGGGLL
jgi:hypothetical protein